MSNNALSLPPAMQRKLKVMRTGFRLLGAVAPGITGWIAVNLFLSPRKRPISARAQPIMNQARQTAVAHGSRQLTAYVWEADGPTVLLVHGWEADASKMRGFVRPLLSHGFRVLAFDAPAHGRSSGRQTNVVDFGGALQTVIQTMGPVPSIVAHSFGAAATLFTLAREPHLGVERVVSIGAPSRLQEMVDIWTSFLGMPPSSAAAMQRKLVDRVGLPLKWLAVETAVAQLDLPGLIIHDRTDTIVSYANAEAIHRNWARSTLMTTEGLNHRGPLYNREVWQQVTAFMAEPLPVS